MFYHFSSFRSTAATNTAPHTPSSVCQCQREQKRSLFSRNYDNGFNLSAGFLKLVKGLALLSVMWTIPETEVASGGAFVELLLNAVEA